MTAPALNPEAERPRAGGRFAVGLALGLFALLALTPLLADLYGGGYLTTLVMRAMILAIAAISLDLLIGQGGMVSFGHAAFIAIGAYAYGIAIDEGVYSIFAILPIAFAAAALFALVTGAISLRTSGVYFIMITLAFAQMLYFAMGSLSRYGADDGLTLWSSADVAGTGLLKSDTGLFLTILVVLVVVGLAAWNEWRKARATAEARGLGDAIITALAEPDPQARVEAQLDTLSSELTGLGESSAAALTEMAGRMDSRRYPVIWEISLGGDRVSELEQRQPQHRGGQQAEDGMAQAAHGALSHASALKALGPPSR